MPLTAVSSSDIWKLEDRDVNPSPYYAGPDVAKLRSGGSLCVLENFKTRQQITPYTCGPVAALMVLEHFQGSWPEDELTVAQKMGTNKISGTDPEQMAAYFREQGWQVQHNGVKAAPKEYGLWKSWVLEHLRHRVPVMVENVDWGGHWRVIIGFDDLGNDYEDDDVLILADPCDSTDHRCDGYNVTSALRFYDMWFDSRLFKSSLQTRPYVVAEPRG